jgi:4a-hydroxytetrahydrobiopterin dehydratase
VIKTEGMMQGTVARGDPPTPPGEPPTLRLLLSGPSRYSIAALISNRLIAMALLDKECVPCKGGVQPLSADQARDLLAQVPDWVLNNEATQVTRKFAFDDFVTSLAFVNSVGELAEREGHHPDISFGWGYAEILLFTHKIHGLHENDFIMAAKIDRVFAESSE